jgi:muramoyltetrapeptide carboxypeptidase LdcA involved in peptidoglycan recycling
MEIPNHKLQIINKFQIPIFKVLNIGHCDLFGIWLLDIGASVATQRH